MSLVLTFKSQAKNSSDGKKTISWTYEANSDNEAQVQLQKSSSTSDYYDSCYIGLVNLTFNKQIYRPGEIHARMEFYVYIDGGFGVTTKESKTYSFADLKHNFVDATVSLTSGNDTIASNYYVDKLIPHFSGKAFYVDFVIYSLDKKLTTEIGNHTFVALRLFNDITKKKANEKGFSCEIHPENKLFFRTVYQMDVNNGTKKDDDSYDYYVYDNGNKVVDYYDDYIQPYLVQYNESFYDLLVRTANRWGEFVYFEDDKLYLGRAGEEKSIAETTPYYEYADETPKTNIDIVTQDDYLVNIEYGKFIPQAGDFFAHDPVYHHKVMQSLLAMKGNVFDWTFDRLTDDPIIARQNKNYLKKQLKKYNEKFFQEPIQNLTGADSERVSTQYKEFDSIALMNMNRHGAEIRVDAELKKENSSNTYRDYVNRKKGTISTDGVTSNSDLESSLNYLDDQYKDIRNIVIAECKVDDNAGTSGKTYKDYVDETTGMVNVPENAPSNTSNSKKFLSGLKDLKKAYEEYKYKQKEEEKKFQVYCQFSNYTTSGGLRSTVYSEVLKYEKKAAGQKICVDFGENYQHLQLGDIFSFENGKEKYVVIQVECAEDKTGVVINSVVTESVKLHFRVYAVKGINLGTDTAPNYIYYPPMLPTGHVRLSGPQMAKIADTFDPLMKVRYRIKYDWQDSDDTDASPWLPVSHEMLANNSGSVWMMEENSLVLLNYADGNIERPYIVGALQTMDKKVPRATQFNTMNLQTPAGHAIRMTDGYGGGAANFLASTQPFVNMIKGCYPDKSGLSSDYGGYSKYYEGGMELTDYFGIYSIKASTDQRNISIKSPYGDVTLNAFTGITISAPNGDIKIQGKNVSIEAGNNVRITSGKNIANGIFGSGLLFGRARSWTEVGADALKTLGNKALSFADFSFFRHGIEVLLRPIHGEMKLKSNRDMTLDVGLLKSETVDKTLGDSLKETVKEYFSWFIEDIDARRENPSWGNWTMGAYSLKHVGGGHADSDMFADKYTPVDILGGLGKLKDNIFGKNAQSELPQNIFLDNGLIS